MDEAGSSYASAGFSKGGTQQRRYGFLLPADLGSVAVLRAEHRDHAAASVLHVAYWVSGVGDLRDPPDPNAALCGTDVRCDVMHVVYAEQVSAPARDRLSVELRPGA